MANSKSELLDKAQKQIQKGKWEEAIELMEAAHRADRADPRVTLRLGDLYKKVDRKKEATEYYCRTADIFAEDGETTKAAATYKMVLRMDPSIEGVQEKLERLSGRSAGLEPSPPPAATSIVTSYNEVHEVKRTPIDLPASGSAWGEPMEVYYGSTDRSSEADTGDDFHDTVPGLVELGSTVGRLVPVNGNGDGAPDMEHIELSSGRDDVVIESFTKKKEAGHEAPAQKSGAGRMRGPSLAFDPDAPSVSEAGMFTDFAADAQAPPETVQAGDISAPQQPRAKREVEFLQDLEEDELWELLGGMDRLTFGPGEAIISEGESGDSIYIITGGRVMVSATRDGTKVKLAELGENEFFGEVSFLTGKPRTADVTAMETTTVMVLSRSQTDKLIDKYPSVKNVLRMFKRERVADTVSTLKVVSEGLF